MGEISLTLVEQHVESICTIPFAPRLKHVESAMSWIVSASRLSPRHYEHIAYLPHQCSVLDKDQQIMKKSLLTYHHKQTSAINSGEKLYPEYLLGWTKIEKN